VRTTDSSPRAQDRRTDEHRGDDQRTDDRSSSDRRTDGGTGGPDRRSDRPGTDRSSSDRSSSDRTGGGYSGRRTDDRRGDAPARGPRTDRPRAGDRGRDDRPARTTGTRGTDRRPPIPEGARASFVAEPRLPDDISPTDLDPEVRRDLRGLQKDTADSVARHLVAAGGLVDEDPQLALEHARFARRRASRIAVVREAAGIAAYHAGEWAEALAELRAARRMGGGPVHVPVMADIERALGRPERAIDLARGPEAAELAPAERIELAIVAAGARRDLGEVDASVVALQIPELDPARRDPWSPRLFYAYADNLLAAGRDADAVQWFVHAADADDEGETDATSRIAEITGDEPEDPDDFDHIAFGEEDVPVGTGVRHGSAGPVGDVDPAEVQPVAAVDAERPDDEQDPAVDVLPVAADDTTANGLIETAAAEDIAASDADTIADAEAPDEDAVGTGSQDDAVRDTPDAEVDDPTGDAGAEAVDEIVAGPTTGIDALSGEMVEVDESGITDTGIYGDGIADAGTGGSGIDESGTDGAETDEFGSDEADISETGIDGVGNDTTGTEEIDGPVVADAGTVTDESGIEGTGPDTDGIGGSATGESAVDGTGPDTDVIDEAGIDEAGIDGTRIGADTDASADVDGATGTAVPDEMVPDAVVPGAVVPDDVVQEVAARDTTAEDERGVGSGSDAAGPGAPGGER
jgi:hypothetical protein